MTGGGFSPFWVFFPPHWGGGVIYHFWGVFHPFTGSLWFPKGGMCNPFMLFVNSS